MNYWKDFSKRISILLLPLLIFSAHLFAQFGAVPAIDVNKILLSDTINQNVLGHADLTQTITPQDVAQGKISFQPLSFNATRNLESVQTDINWWFCFRLENSADSTNTVYLMPGLFVETFNLFRYDSASKQLAPMQPELPNIPDSIGYRALTLSPKESNLYFVHLKFARTAPNALSMTIIRSYYVEPFARLFRTSRTNGPLFSYVISGILLMMVFYSLAVYVLNGSVEFLYYCVFACSTGLLFFLKSYLFKRASSFNFFFESYLDFILQSTGVFFYFIFMDRFLAAKKNYPFLHRLFRLGQAVIVISGIAFSIIYFLTSNYTLQILVETYTKYVWIVTTGLFVVYATTRKNKMLNILAAGHLLILVFTFSSQILIQYPGFIKVPIPSIWRSSLFYYQLGMTFELILFLVALALKNRHYMAERTREREKLLLENERKEFEKQLAVVEAKQEERNRISVDMHDELGSGVTAIRLMSEIVKTKMKGNTLPEIEKISTNANDLISKMNTIIWTMTSSNDKLDSMIAYLRSYAIEFFESTSINCHFKSPENIPPEEMSGEKRRNIFLSVKETLNNVAKHSKATDVSIDIQITHSLMKISVHDNGIGINFQKLREFGNGLNNIKKRMEGVEGAFSIENNGGTTTVLAIPL